MSSWADTPFAAEAIKPATVAGRHLLLARLHGGVGAIAEKISPAYRNRQAWRARAGAYRATDVLPGSYPGVVPRTARSRLTTGCWCGSFPIAPRFSLRRPHDGHSRSDFPRSPFERGAGDVLTPAGSTLTLLATCPG